MAKTSILLDTNTLLWLLSESELHSKISKSGIKTIHSAETVYVSSISILEITIKTMLGKLTVSNNLQTALQNMGAQMLSFTAKDAETIVDFKELSRHDPFDRMLMAQAKNNNLIFVTGDKLLISLNYDFILSAL